MSDEDHDLTESVLATDEGPRPEWVAALRAELESSFDVTVRPRRPSPPSRPPMNSALSLSLGAAASIALLFVATFWHPSKSSPSKVLPTPPSSTISTTLPARTGPTTIATTSCPYDVASGADSQVVTTGSSVWIVNKCFDGHHWQGIEIVEISAASGKVLGTRRLSWSDLQIPYAPSRLVVHFVGVLERQVILDLNDNPGFSGYAGVDMDGGAITPVSVPEGTRLAAVVGNVLVAIGGVVGGVPEISPGPIFVPVAERGTVAMLDLASGTTHRVGLAASLVGRPTVSSDGVLFWTAHTSNIVRLDTDGSHKLDQFSGSIYPSGAVAAAGNVWVAIEDPTADNSPSLVRIDPNDGHALALPVPMPEGSQWINMFDTLHASARGLLITDPSSGWWWIDNDGVIKQLAVPDGTFIAVIDDRILVVDAAGKVVVHSTVELAAAS